jgi:predicted site-specific integrase-resolvase
MSATESHEEQPRAATGGRRLYSLPQARAQLAGISRATLDREIAAGKLAVVRIRSRRYVAAEDLERYIAARREVAALD